MSYNFPVKDPCFDVLDEPEGNLLKILMSISDVRIAVIANYPALYLRLLPYIPEDVKTPDRRVSDAGSN